MRVLLLVALAACHHGAAPAAPVVDDSGDDDAAERTGIGREGDDDAGEPPVAITGDGSVLERALEAYASMRSTTYSHRTRVDAAQGRFDVDCSGFVGYVLAEASPRAYAELRAATTRRPLARHFVEFFQSLAATPRTAWQPLAGPAELVPGDVIAWLRPADVTTSNTGHVMIVRELPRRHPVHAGVWTIPVIDATAAPHGASDSRKPTRATGLGIGEILLVVDDAGAPVGYRWSRGRKAKLHLTTIALARVRPI